MEGTAESFYLKLPLKSYEVLGYKALNLHIVSVFFQRLGLLNILL